MARSARQLCAAHKLALLLCGATIFCAEAGDVITDSSIPAFNADTDGHYQILIALTNGTDLSTSFESSASYNTTEGVVLLPNNINFGRSGVEASFRTSFTLVAGAAPVSFFVGGDSSIIREPCRCHDPANANASLAFVEVGRMKSGCSCAPDYGLNVTVSPTSAAPGGRTVWIDFRAADHSLYVYIAGAGEPRPLNHHLNKFVKLGVGGRAVGLSAAKVGDIISGVRDWNFTVEVDKHPEYHSQDSVLNVISSLVALVIGLAAAIAITTPAVYLYFNSKYRRWKKEQDKLAKVMQDLPGVPTKVEFTDIKKATKNFHDTMKLGKGGFGTVYRCTLPASASRTGKAMEVAVKKFTKEVEDQRYDDFLAEVSIINRLRHKNIVPLVGWSYNKGVPVLVYEYMTNGSLDQLLFRRGGHDRHDPMDDATIWQWDTRYSIVRDIATGLHYVHHEHEPMVLHRDIKASNIMLDSTFRARLGDFGIACTVAANKSYVTGLAGTPGYIGPDYAVSCKATRQTDIYAFGVLMLEVVTGKKNLDVPPDDYHITDWVWRLHRQGMLLQAVDNILTAGHRQEDIILNDEAGRLLLLGLACTHPNPSNRPSMVEVLQIIHKLAPTPEVPLERPSFVWPPEDWRTCNSMYSTAMSDWERSSTNTMELVMLSQDLPSSPSTEEQAYGHNEAGSLTAIHTPSSNGATLRYSTLQRGT